MLSLQLRDGDYLTIGEDIVIKVSCNSTIKLSVQAPREIPIMRGELLERSGAQRPECVMEPHRQHKPGPDLSWNRNKTQALIAMRQVLGQMDGRDDRVKDLRRQLDFLFPPEFASNETIYAPK